MSDEQEIIVHHNLFIVCHKCKTKLSSNMTNTLTNWRDTKRAPSIDIVLASIRYLMSSTDGYGFGEGGIDLREYIRQKMILALFKMEHKSHPVQIYRANAAITMEVLKYKIRPMYDMKEAMKNWNKWGDWTGGHAGFPLITERKP